MSHLVDSEEDPVKVCGQESARIQTVKVSDLVGGGEIMDGSFLGDISWRSPRLELG